MFEDEAWLSSLTIETSLPYMDGVEGSADGGALSLSASVYSLAAIRFHLLHNCQQLTWTVWALWINVQELPHRQCPARKASHGLVRDRRGLVIEDKEDVPAPRAYLAPISRRGKEALLSVSG